MSRLLCGSYLVGLLLAGCGGNHERESPPPPPPADDQSKVESNTTVLAPLVFRVMREGGGGIDATINKLDLENQASFYARVPGNGEVAMEKPCEAGERFQAEPKVEAFQLGPPQECASRVEFMLLSTLATLQFMKRGDDAAAAGDLLVAQANYGIAADRLQFAKPEQSRRLRVLSTVAAGRALGVTQPVQGTGGSEQPTAEFKDRVRQFQKENGIKETGELDAGTRESIGRMQLRGREVVVPPTTGSAKSLASPATKSAAPALAVTPQTAIPAIEVRVNTAEMLALPASPQTAEIIHANRARAVRAAE